MDLVSKRYGTILFCDVRNFTGLFEDRDPVEAIQFVNKVIGLLGRVVEQHQGIVDRFTGDGFMAHFGIKYEDSEHALNACKACIAIRQKINEINQERYLSDEEIIQVGVGMSTGEVAYGLVETKALNQITVLGDRVNTAARIEEMTKYFLVDVLICDKTFELVQDKFKFRPMPLKSVQGKREKLKTYWLLPTNQLEEDEN